ncbi:MAG: MFS transporter [Eubacteriales bacterium]|nr:MFS transporter [Eubacteriales bacterium]
MSVIYLLGLFIGAIDTGIITPARPIIQSQLGVDANLGIWMITIYTLTYAAIIPIAGKLADTKGRKPIYLLSIGLFGAGSLICALSAFVDSFGVLMLGRIVQAAGGGGIMPVATAEFGTSFPEEKRGMALGLVGAVYGLANVLGASAGSAVLDIAGVENWQWIFLINVPICIFIVIAGIAVLPNNRAEHTKAMDKLGTLLMTLLILSLLYGLKNLDFFNFAQSFMTVKVWPFILACVVLTPLFVRAERKAEDPIFHIEYASNRQIMIILALALVVGCSMMGMIFIPQFSENCLRLASGSGGYFVIILGICSGAASMISGKLIDRKGAKPVMALGFLTTIAGCLYLGFIAVRFVNLINVIISLVVIGFGLGLTMGTPLNYMMLRNTSDEESNSALATLSLVRSIGTAVAPAIMVGFIVHAAAGLQTGLMELLPEQVEMPPLPYAQEIDDSLEKMKSDPSFAAMMGDMEMPRLSDMTKMDMSMSENAEGSFEMPADVLERLQNSDVTNITENTVYLVNTMFDAMTPTVIEKITAGIDAGIDGINAGAAAMEKAMAGMPAMDDTGKMPGMPPMSAAGDNPMAEKIGEMKELASKLTAVKEAIPTAFEQAGESYADAVRENSDAIEDYYQATVNTGYRNMYVFVAAVNAVGLLLLAFYREQKKKD